MIRTSIFMFYYKKKKTITQSYEIYFFNLNGIIENTPNKRENVNILVTTCDCEYEITVSHTIHKKKLNNPDMNIFFLEI